MINLYCKYSTFKLTYATVLIVEVLVGAKLIVTQNKTILKQMLVQGLSYAIYDD